MISALMELLVFLLLSIIVDDASCAKITEKIRPSSTNGHLCKKFYEMLNEPSSKSFAFSPLSLELTLHMLHEACPHPSPSATEIATYGFKIKNYRNVVDYTKTLKSLIAKLSPRSRSSSMTVTAALALDQHFEVNSTYLQQMKKFFGNQNFKPVQDDFRKNSEKVVGDINELVSKATGGKIRGLLPQGSINGDTPVILLNTILLESAWEKKFTEIEDEHFYTFDNQATTATMVGQINTVRYCEIDGTKIVEIPTKNRLLSVYFVLPGSRTREELAALWKDDIVEKCGNNGAGFDYEDVEVSIPEFKIEYSTDLVDTLNALNINAIFDPNTAELDKTFKSEDGRSISVDKVPQKVVIEIDRDGIKAAAATAAIMTSRFGDDDEIEQVKIFKANRPFLFYVSAQFSVHSDRNYLFAGQFTGN